MQLRRQGVAMLLVEQNIRFGLRLADRACLLQGGRVVHSGGAGELDAEQLAAYLGVGRLLRNDLAAGLRRTGRTARHRHGSNSPDGSSLSP